MEMLRVNTNGFTTNVLGLPREPSLQGSGFVQVSDCLFFRYAAGVFAVWSARPLIVVTYHLHCLCHVLQIARRREPRSDVK